MINLLPIVARASVVTLALLTGVTGSVSAAPIAPVALQIPIAAANDAAQAQLVTDRTIWRRQGNWNRGGNRNWNGNSNWNGNRHWRGNRYWNGNRYWRGGGGYYGGYGSGIYLGFGGLGLGYSEPYYYAPRYYAPRRAYRAGNAHVEWCYARYRSYRAYDNTFQPYHGPRQQCYSPY